MSRVKTGKIYSISSNQTDEVYIGSTFGTLNKRFHVHKGLFKIYTEKRGGNFVSSFKILEHEDANIILLEEHKGITKEELKKLEGEHIKKNKCVNKNTAGTCKDGKYPAEVMREYLKKWKEDNPDKIKAYDEKRTIYNKRWYEKNKEMLKQKRQTHSLIVA